MCITSARFDLKVEVSLAKSLPIFEEIINFGAIGIGHRHVNRLILLAVVVLVIYRIDVLGYVRKVISYVATL